MISPRACFCFTSLFSCLPKKVKMEYCIADDISRKIKNVIINNMATLIMFSARVLKVRYLTPANNTAKYKKGIIDFSIASIRKSSNVLDDLTDHFFNLFNTGPLKILMILIPAITIPKAIIQSFTGFSKKIWFQKFIVLFFKFLVFNSSY
jgi:hypothetical protein